MAELPTPAVVPVGQVVRLRAGVFFTSPVMSPSQAVALAEQLEVDIAHDGDARGYITFATADGGRARIKARTVTIIEHGRPRPHRDQRAQVVNVFLDGGSVNACDLVETEAASS